MAYFRISIGPPLLSTLRYGMPSVDLIVRVKVLETSELPRGDFTITF